ncbi:hypothetical protein K503DRAFT_804824 [Rhizopogon vinicolor AM-OR11-026]|uniref:Uncharacterized protein n=1 Tax=Rhizopogon vinicolor AM-OR11-026 TaxID=1314800 RepID=A0A1B7MJV6_9AGAM|nr:hypothetical protein K503DRAFT_804824 [Rhizopogon vinicolor AM-OR11-026]
MAKAMGSKSTPVTLHYSVKWAGPKLNIVSPHGPHERDVLARINTNVAPEGHKKLHASVGMTKFMTDLALKPKFLQEYKLDPVAVVDAAEGLSDLEKFGLKFARSGPVDALMKATEFDIANGRQLTEDDILDARGPLLLFTPLLIIAATSDVNDECIRAQPPMSK